MLKIITDAKAKQKKPEKATVVNLGVSDLHLKVTEKTENPIDESIPKIKPTTELDPELPKAIIIIPKVAIKIFVEIKLKRKLHCKKAAQTNSVESNCSEQKMHRKKT